MARYPGSRRKLSNSKRRMRTSGRASARKPHQASGRTSIGYDPYPEDQLMGGGAGGSSCVRDWDCPGAQTCNFGRCSFMLEETTITARRGGKVRKFQQGGHTHPMTMTGIGHTHTTEGDINWTNQATALWWEDTAEGAGTHNHPTGIGGRANRMQSGGNTHCGPGMRSSNGGCVPSNGTRYKSGGKVGNKEFSNGVRSNRRK